MPCCPPCARSPTSSSSWTSGASSSAADHPEADVVLQQRPELQAQVPLQQRHQRGDLGCAAASSSPPRTRRASARRCRAGPRSRRRRAPPRCRPGGPRPAEGAAGGPAPVAVHDDGDVRRQPVEVDLSRQRLVGRAGRIQPTPGSVQETYTASGKSNLDLTRGGRVSSQPRRETVRRRVPSGPPGRGRAGRSNSSNHAGSRRPAPTSDQAPGNGPDHVPEEAVAGHLVAQQPSRRAGAPGSSAQPTPRSTAPGRGATRVTRRRA